MSGIDAYGNPVPDEMFPWSQARAQAPRKFGMTNYPSFDYSKGLYPLPVPLTVTGTGLAAFGQDLPNNTLANGGSYSITEGLGKGAGNGLRLGKDTSLLSGLFGNGASPDKDWFSPGNVADGINALASALTAYSGYRSMKNAKEMQNFNMGLTKANYANAAKAYNTSLNARANRAAGLGTKGMEGYYDKWKVKDTL